MPQEWHGTIGILGAGRAGSALARGLSHAGQHVVAVWSRSEPKARALAASLAQCVACASAQQVAEAADLVFLTVSDDAIAEVAQSVVFRPGNGVVHCSGATGLEPLEPARALGARIGSFHPLRLFPDPTVTSAGPFSCAIAVDGDATLCEGLVILAQCLGARPIRIPGASRGGYHAASHYAAAFLCVLLEEGAQLLRSFGMTREDADWALLQLACSTLDAVSLQGPAKAMAGAYSRGDMQTARRHLLALDALGAHHGTLYRVLAERSIDLARAARRIDDGTARGLRQLLAARD